MNGLLPPTGIFSEYFVIFFLKDFVSPYFSFIAPSFLWSLGSLLIAVGVGVNLSFLKIKSAKYTTFFCLTGGIIALIGLASLYAGTQPLKKEASQPLFDKDFKSNNSLLSLLELIGMPESNRTIVSINEWAQKNLLLRNERYEEQTKKFETLKPQLYPLFRELGFIEAKLPHFQVYEGAIVHGALLKTVRLRFHYLIEQWNKGIRFTHLYFLSGERPLTEPFENFKALMETGDSPLKIRHDWTVPEKIPTTECEMIKWVWDQTEIPKTLRQEVTVHFINAPMKICQENSTLLRPTTDDTVLSWLQETPPAGLYLAISNAPYILRQDLVMNTIASGNEYYFDTVGPSIGDCVPIAIIVDELARTIFQIKKTTQKSTLENREEPTASI